MRISANKDDPGYAQYRASLDSGKAVVIFLDGAQVKDCQTADDQLGVVSYFVRDENGYLQVSPLGDSALIETRQGKVSITFS